MTECVIRGERTSSCARPADVGVCSPECAIRYEGVSFSYKPGVPFMEGLSAADDHAVLRLLHIGSHSL